MSAASAGESCAIKKRLLRWLPRKVIQTSFHQSGSWFFPIIFFTSTSASDFAIVEPSEKMYMRFASLRVSSSRSNVVGTKCLLQNSLSRNPTVRERRYQTCHNVARVTQTLILIDSSPPTFTPGPRTLPHKLQIEVVRIKVYAFGPWVNCGCITSEVRQGPTFISYRRWKQTCLIGSMNYRPMS